MHGDDLVLTWGDQALATIDDYAHHTANFAGLDLGQGIRPIADFVTQPAATLSAQSLDAGDLLAEYVPAASGLREAAPLPEPWSMLDASATMATPAAEPAISPELSAPGLDPAPMMIVASPADRPTAADLWLPGDDLSASSHLPVEHAVIDPAQDRHASGCSLLSLSSGLTWPGGLARRAASCCRWRTPWQRSNFPFAPIDRRAPVGAGRHGASSGATATGKGALTMLRFLLRGWRC